MSDDERWPLAAIDHDGSVDVDALLAGIVEAAGARGWRVRGLLRETGATCGSASLACEATMRLVDIETGERYVISQDLGPGSTGCRADPAGFAQAAMVMQRARQAGPDLVVSNRFGSLESEGGGFRAELLDVVAQGLPLLTIVARRHRAAWDAFSGGAPVLPADAGRVMAWLEGAVAP